MIEIENFLNGFLDLTSVCYYVSVSAFALFLTTQSIVAENNSQYYYNRNPLYLLPDVNNTLYTSSVYGSYIFAAYSVGFSFPEDDDLTTYESLLETSDSAVSKVNFDNITTSEYEEGDTKGGFSLGVAVNKVVDTEDT